MQRPHVFIAFLARWSRSVLAGCTLLKQITLRLEACLHELRGCGRHDGEGENEAHRAQYGYYPHELDDLLVRFCHECAQPAVSPDPLASISALD